MEHSGPVRGESWVVVLRQNNAKGVLSKGDFLCVYVCRESLAYTLKIQIQPSVRLLTAFGC